MLLQTRHGKVWGNPEDAELVQAHKTLAANSLRRQAYEVPSRALWLPIHREAPRV